MPALNISGLLRDVSNIPLPNMTIEIYVKLSSDQNYPNTPTLTLTTNANGNFSGSHSVTGGYYDVKAVFPGTDRYKRSEAEVNNIDARESTSITVTVSVS